MGSPGRWPAICVPHRPRGRPSTEGCSSVATPTPDRRLLVAVDMENYSGKDNAAQYRAQQIFQQVMREAADELRLDRANWVTQQGGDGELAILPASASELTVV